MMTKTFFILCLLSGIGLSVLSGQPPVPDGTKTTVFTTKTDGYYGFLYCNNLKVDDISGSGVVTIINHYEAGKLIWYTMHFKGEATGTSGEVFEINEITNQVHVDADMNPIDYTAVFNYRGSLGNHYIGLQSYDLANNTWIINRAICIENGPKKP
jgi:hypothetical protein